jgi:phosphohistidine phosphatase
MTGAAPREARDYPGSVRLFLIRHAEAAAGDPDELRTLTPAGRADARRLGAVLAGTGELPDAVVTSPLLRARETGQALARACGCGCAVDERLAPGATPESVRAAISGRGERVAVVAHQPDCARIAAALTGEGAPPFPPAAMVVIDLP